MFFITVKNVFKPRYISQDASAASCNKAGKPRFFKGRF